MQLKRVFTLREKSTQGKRINIPRVASKNKGYTIVLIF